MAVNEDYDDAFEEFANEDEPGDDEKLEPEEEPKEPEEELEEPEKDEENEPEEKTLEEKFEQLMEENKKLQHYKNSNEGRVSALQRKVDDLVASNHKTPEKEEEPEEPEEDEEWDKFVEEDEYTAGHVASKVEKSNTKLKAEIMDEIDTRFKPVQENEHKSYVEGQMRLMDENDANWYETVNSDDFKDWIGTQPAKIQEMGSSEEAEDYIYLLDGFKSANQTVEERKELAKEEAEVIKKQRKQKLASNESVQRRGSGHKTGAPEDFDAAFEYYAKEEEKKRYV